LGVSHFLFFLCSSREKDNGKRKGRKEFECYDKSKVVIWIEGIDKNSDKPFSYCSLEQQQTIKQ